MRVLFTCSRTYTDRDTAWAVLDIIAKEAASVPGEELVIVHGARFPRDSGGWSSRASTSACRSRHRTPGAPKERRTWRRRRRSRCAGSTPTGRVLMVEPYYRDADVSLYAGDCLEVLRCLPAESVDAVVTDPPAGISFMGRDWDHHKGGREQWSGWLAEVMRECWRVAKPGAHAIVWSLPRTSHWTACGLEDAGWEVRDRISHLFGSGFPKSLDVSKAIDKAAGAEREVVGIVDYPGREGWANAQGATPGDVYQLGIESAHLAKRITAPATDDARRWAGWGTALKPAVEDWWVVRKPPSGTVAANVLAYGTGALNIDACRTQWDDASLAKDSARRQTPRTDITGGHLLTGAASGYVGDASSPPGRWPTNVVLSHAGNDVDGDLCAEGCVPGCPVAELDRQSGTVASTGTPYRAPRPGIASSGGYGGGGVGKGVQGPLYSDTGGASRFFPVLRYERKCALFGMLTGCGRVSGAAAKSLPAGRPQGVAANAASGTSSQPSVARSAPSTSSAATAPSRSAHTPETTPVTAPEAAPTKSDDLSALRAASAGSLCDSCVTAIARSVAATSRGHSPAIPLGLPSTADFSERILSRSLALIAADLASSDTTSTTTALTTSLGCAVDAIRTYIMRASRLAPRRSEASGLPLDAAPCLKYEAKAPASERPKVDGEAHATVKPLTLLRWLVQLVTPPGGVVLEPFAGSGTTIEACLVEGFRCIAVEREAKYLPLIMARITKPIASVLPFDAPEVADAS
jgi:hypothetical protein